MAECKHQWVMYQPLKGEPYECCALAGCGITRAEYDSKQLSFPKEQWSWKHYNDTPERILPSGFVKELVPDKKDEEDTYYYDVWRFGAGGD